MSARTADVVAALRELLAAGGLLLDFDVSAAEHELRRELGINVLLPDELVGAGVDIQAGAAAFSRAVLPTLAVPIADEDQLTAFLEARRRSAPMRARRYRGHQIYTWRLGAHAAVHAVRAPGWLLISLAVDFDGLDSAPSGASDEDPDGEDPDGADPDGEDPDGEGMDAGDRTDGIWPSDAAWLADTGWLDGPLDAARSGHPADLRRALDTARRLRGRPRAAARAPGVLGMLRPDHVLRALHRHAGAFEACARLAGVAREVAIAADVDWDRAAGVIAVELAPEAAAALAELAAPAPAAWQAYRAEAPLQVSWAIDPRALDLLGRASGCPLVGSPAVGRRQLPRDLPTAFHAALWELDRDALRVRGGVHLALSDRGFADALLDRIPQRRLLERTRTMAGQPVKVISVPLLGELAYHLTDGSLTAVAGATDAMERLVSPAERAPGPSELAAVTVIPERVRDLDAVLSQLADLSGRVSESSARRTARRLRRYRRGHVRLELDGARLVLRADMALR